MAVVTHLEMARYKSIKSSDWPVVSCSFSMGIKVCQLCHDRYTDLYSSKTRSAILCDIAWRIFTSIAWTNWHNYRRRPFFIFAVYRYWYPLMSGQSLLWSKDAFNSAFILRRSRTFRCFPQNLSCCYRQTALSRWRDSINQFSHPSHTHRFNPMHYSLMYSSTHSFTYKIAHSPVHSIHRTILNDASSTVCFAGGLQVVSVFKAGPDFYILQCTQIESVDPLLDFSATPATGAAEVINIFLAEYNVSLSSLIAHTVFLLAAPQCPLLTISDHRWCWTLLLSIFETLCAFELGILACFSLSDVTQALAMAPLSPSSSLKKGGGGASTGLRSLESLDKLELGYLLANTDFADFKDAFIMAGVTGYVLQDLESSEELKELGIIMPSLKFKALLRRLAEVSVWFVSCSQSFAIKWSRHQIEHVLWNKLEARLYFIAIFNLYSMMHLDEVNRDFWGVVGGTCWEGGTSCHALLLRFSPPYLILFPNSAPFDPSVFLLFDSLPEVKI